jgi:protein Tob/BTG
MKDEVKVAVGFLCHVIERNNINIKKELDKDALSAFRERLVDLLCDRFREHWFPEKPSQGQGFRCIRVNDASLRESLISRACSHAGLTYEQLSLPSELTIWIDPKEVCCR